MAAEEKILEVGRESHETPQAITITIVDPSALDGNTLSTSLVTSVEAQDDDADPGSSIVMVSGEGPKSILQTVTETHMGDEELPIISNISNPDEEEELEDEETVVDMNKVEAYDAEGEEAEAAESFEAIGLHCLICNLDLATVEEDEHIPVFKTQTSTTHRKLAVFLGSLTGQKLTSRKAHSDILCRRCFSLLDRVDSLEVEIKETKEEIVNKYQETVSAYGGRARRRKPTTAKKTDYVFPKVEPEDEADQLLEMELDGNFEPQVEDLMEEDPGIQDEEWEPEFKKPRIKRESSEIDSTNGPPKRKRGRPRKDATKPKAEEASASKGGGADSIDVASPTAGPPTCPVCSTTFSFSSQMRRHIRYEHPEFNASELDSAVRSPSQPLYLEEMHREMKEEHEENDMLPMNLCCPWCEAEYDDKVLYDEHVDEHGAQAHRQYIRKLEELGTKNSVKQIQKGLPSESKGKKIQCRLCNYDCTREVKIEEHIDKCHEGIARHCTLCGEKCIDTPSFHTHLIHHFNGTIECPICPIKFSIRSNLLNHLKCFHSSGYAIICEECKIEFNNYEKFEAHQAHEHGHGTKKTCELCEEEFLTVDLEGHLDKHENEAKWKESHTHECNMCQASFLFLSNLYHHKYQDHSDYFSFKCCECERRFKTARMLASHRWGHRYGTHQCPACRLKYRQVDQLKRHLLMVHPEVEGYTCKFCPTSLKNYTTYVAHLKFKHPKEAGYNTQPVKCRVCGKSFDHKVQWKYHMRNHTRSLQTCRYCGIAVKNLDIHMNLHTRKKKYECRDCGAVYHNKASFHFHMKRVHMGEEVRKHICDLCAKGFLTPADLRIHLSRVHHGERNYWCNICKKGYKNKVSLTYHQRLHTGERPHLCTLCNRSFRVPSYLKRHVEHDHRAQYTGVYYKEGRPKSQEYRALPRRYHQRSNASVTSPTEEDTTTTTTNTNTTIPEVVQITVPMEMGREVISAVASMEDLGSEALELEQGGVVYVVYEN